MYIKISKWKTVYLKELDITKPNNYCYLNVNGIHVIQNKEVNNLLKIKEFIELSVEKGLRVLDLVPYVDKYNDSNESI